MKYEALKPIARVEAESLLNAGDPQVVATTLLQVALHKADRIWVENQIVRLARHPSPDVRRAAALSIGHLVRRFGTLDRERMLPVLEMLGADPGTAGVAEDAWDDIVIFAPDLGIGVA